jgi:mRNA-degrading endonuclease RelE of RelBE toxin-antitoxin system
VGDHRIAYTIDDGVLLVVVIVVAHRRDAYR